jgi:hypothetical protein
MVSAEAGLLVGRCDGMAGVVSVLRLWKSNGSATFDRWHNRCSSLSIDFANDPLGRWFVAADVAAGNLFWRRSR